MKRLAATAILLLSVVSQARGVETLRGEITYVARDAVFINLGSQDGVQPGDSGYAARDGLRMARLLVNFASRSSSSCAVIPAEAGLNAGDEAVIWVRAAPAVLDKGEPGTVEPGGVPSEIREEAPPLRSQKKKSAGLGRVSGSLGVQVWRQGGGGDYGYHYTQSTARLSTEIENIQGSHLTLSLNLRARRLERAAPASEESTWKNRFYEVSLSYDNDLSPYGFGFGRVPVRGVAGVGRIDGAYFDYMSTAGWRAGAFAGTDPDYETGFKTDKTKTGMFAGYGGDGGGFRWNSSAALVGVYESGEIDEEFICWQADVARSQLWSLFTNTLVSVNRGWRSEGGNSTLQVGYWNLSSRCHPAGWLGLSAGYSSSSNVRSGVNRDVPDSLFDGSTRQRITIGLEWRPAKNLRATADGAVRLTEAEEGSQPSLGGGIRAQNPFGIDLDAGIRGSIWENLYARGNQYSLDLYRAFAGGMASLQTEVGQRDSELKSTGQAIVYRWLNLTASVNPYRRLYASAAWEMDGGDDGDSWRVILDLIVRF